MRALALLVVASTLLAGCTSDGYLGEIDEGNQAAQREARASNYWERAAASHKGDLRVSARTLELSGDLAPIEVTSAKPAVNVDGATNDTAILGLANVSVDGERGWLTLETGVLIEGPMEFRGYALVTEGSRAEARLQVTRDGISYNEMPWCGGPDVVGSYDGRNEYRVRPFECPPPSLNNRTRGEFRGATLDGSFSLQGGGAHFHPTNGLSRDVSPSDRLEANEASFVALLNTTSSVGSFGLTLELSPSTIPKTWVGNLTVRATPPSGTLRLASGEQLLAPYNEASFTMRGGGTFALREGAEWTFEQNDAEFVDVQAGAPRLEATLRLAPEQFNATGPAGNTTRVKLILAETSLGATAHITGYRIEGDVNARYVGWEPFAISNELLRIMQETEGPIAPAVLLTLGVAVPIVAFGEAFAAAFQTLFPPSLAGTIGPGEARLLTFDLEMPDAARDVEILIESRNADPVRATLRLAPIA